MKRSSWRIALFASALASLTPGAEANDTAIRVGQKFGDWIFQCEAIAEGKTACALGQTLLLQQTRKPIVRFNVMREGDALRFSAMLPTAINIPAGVNLQIDGKEKVVLDLETCTPAACFAEKVIDPQLLQTFRTGKSMEIRFRFHAANEHVQLAGSLAGLSEGIDATGWEPKKPAPAQRKR